MRRKILLLFAVLLSIPLFGQTNISSIVNKVKSAVVTIITYDENGDTLCLGSGFFVTADGILVSNRHVLLNSDSAIVKTADGTIYSINNIISENIDADLIMFDLANLSKPIMYLKATKSLPLQGERILAFGSPYGLELTVSDGIVSAIREIPEFGSIIQITAPISPGSSGGPVVNLNGTVVGVATFQHIEGQNLNFAMPSKLLFQFDAKKRISLRTWTSGIIDDWVSSADGLAFQALVYIWAAEFDSALYYFEQASRTDSLDADIFFWMGYCCNELGNYRKAINMYNKAISLNPHYAAAYCNIGTSYYILRLYQDAIKVCNKAIDLDPDAIEPYRTIALSYAQLQKPYAAIQAYEEIIRIDPNSGAAYYNIGLIFYQLNNFKNARDCFENAKHILKDDPDVLYMLGICSYELDDLLSALNALMQTINIAPTYAEAYYSIALIYGDFEEHEKAIEYCQKALLAEPAYADALYVLSVLYVIQGDDNAAWEQQRKLMTIDSKLAIQLKSLLLENTKPSYENYKPQKRYGFQLIFVLKDFDDDEHLIILLADGTRLLLESKTYCFTYGFWEGLALDAKVGPVDVKIFHNNKTYEYWIEDEY